jgi:hypothetical protein
VPEKRTGRFERESTNQMLMEEEERERGKAIAKFTHLTVTERPRFIAHFQRRRK